MPQDAYTISYLTKELNNTLDNAKITKIIQPESDEVALFVYTKTGGKKLVISANGTTPRCHFSDEEKQNPITAPAFCMLLRKYLTNAFITSVSQNNGDRVIVFDIISKNEMQDNTSYKLIVELITRSANIVLVDSSYTILGALKKTFLDDAYSRSIINGYKYAYPEQNKISPVDPLRISELFSNETINNISTFIQDNISGLAYITIKEIFTRANVNIDSYQLTDFDKSNIAKSFFHFANLIEEKEYKPCIAIENNEVKDYFVTPYFSSYQNFVFCDTLNDAVAEFYKLKDSQLRIKEHSKKLRDIIKNNINRSEKKLSVQRQQLKDSEDLEYDKMCGELITSNIYKIKYGDSQITVDNYYVNPIEKITIKLKNNLSPSSNAQNYYKKYAKKKRTIEFLTREIIETTAHLNMLKCFLSTLSNIKNVEELSLVEEDLINSKIIKNTNNQKRIKLKKTMFAEYQFDGHKVFVGRNSTENEYITHKLGKNKDMWFHIKNGFGSHVLIKYENRDFSDQVYEFAAELASYYSEFRNSPKVEVDYTEVKNVKKPPNNKLGLVIYNTNYSMTVTPKEHNDNKIK